MKRILYCFMAVMCALALGARQSWALGDSDQVKLSVDIAGEYTDNRDALPDGEDNFDFFLTPRLAAQFRAANDRTVLEFYYAPSYRYRSDPSDIQNDTELHHDLGLNFKHKLVETTAMRLNEQFNLTDDPAIIENGTTLRRDCTYTMNRVGAGLNLRTGKKSSVDVSGKHMVKMYEEDEVAAESDETSVDGTLRLWREFVPTFGMMADVSAGTFDYDSARGLERGFSTLAAGLGMEKRMTKETSLTVLAGWMSLDYVEEDLDSETSPYADVLLKVSPVPQTRINALVSYRLRDSGVYPFATQRYLGGNLGLEWDMNGFLTLGVGGGYRYGEYEAGMAPPETEKDPSYVPPTGGEEEVWQGNAGLTYKINQQASITLAQTYERVDTDLSTSWSYTRNATRLGVRKQF